MSTLTRTLGTSALAAATLAAVVLPATSASAWGYTPPPSDASILSVDGDTGPLTAPAGTLHFASHDTTPEIEFSSTSSGTATIRSGQTELCSAPVTAGRTASCVSTELAAWQSHPITLDVVTPTGAHATTSAVVDVLGVKPAPTVETARASGGSTTVVASAAPGEWVLVALGGSMAWAQADESGRAELTVRGGEAGQTAYAKIADGDGTTWGFDWVTFTIA